MSHIVTWPKPTSLMSNDCQCKPPHHLRFILCTVQDIGLLMTVWATEVGTLLWKCDEVLTSPWHLGDISVTSRSRDQWSIGPNYRLWSVDWHRVTAGQSSSHSMWENSQQSQPPSAPLQFSPITDHSVQCATFISGPGVRVSPATITRPARPNILNISVAPRHPAPRSHPPAAAWLWPWP